MAITITKNTPAVFVKNTELRDYVPKVGNGCYCPSGSDSHGYVIKEVSPDLTWFRYGRGKEKDEYDRVAALIVGKNRNGRGLYMEARWDGRKWRPRRMDVTHVRCSSFGRVVPTDEVGECETYLDPSF